MVEKIPSRLMSFQNYFLEQTSEQSAESHDIQVKTQPKLCCFPKFYISDPLLEFALFISMTLNLIYNVSGIAIDSVCIRQKNIRDRRLHSSRNLSYRSLSSASEKDRMHSP